LNVSLVKRQLGDHVSHNKRQMPRRFWLKPARPRSVLKYHFVSVTMPLVSTLWDANESLAMWDLYGQGSGIIAIKSTVVLLLDLQGRSGLAGWQWLFLIEGLPAVILSVVLFMCLPDTPANANWLTSGERAWLLDRVGKERKEGKIAHTDDILRPLLDYRVVLLGIIYFCSIGSAYAYPLSAPLIIQNLTGFTATRVGFVVAGMSLFNALCVLLVPLHSDRTGERFWHIAMPALLATMGFLIGGRSSTPLVGIVALAFGQAGLISAHPVIWSLPASFLRDKSVAAGIAAISSLGIFGGFLGPIWMGRMRDATQSYSIGIMCLAIPTLVIAATALYMKKLARSN
jgi:MFS transporter, ACS family, tartrate transporter